MMNYKAIEKLLTGETEKESKVTDRKYSKIRQHTTR